MIKLLNEDAFSDVNYVLSMFEDDDNLDKLYDIANRYNTSLPVSGSWDTETEHEQRAIANEFNIPLKAAKDVMINILGFDEGQFRKHKLNVVTEIRNTDMLNILYDLDDEYNALHKSKADVRQEQEAIADTFDISMDDAKWIMMDVLYFEESQFDDIDKASSSKITSNILDMFEYEDMLDKLYDVVDKYNTSSPVSGNWNTETKHQQKTIAKEFNISLEDAKDVMINILGFDEEMFKENKSFKNRKRYTKQFNETTYTKNSFKVGDKVCSKQTYKNPANIGFCGTIIDINRNGLCTIECADGTVIDDINPDRIAYDSISENYYCESLTMKSLEKLLFKFIKTNPNIEFYSSDSNESVTIYSYGKTDYIALAKEFAEYIKQNNPSEAENIKLMADAMYDDSYSVICPCGKRKSVYFNFTDNTNDNDDSDIYVEYTYVLG